MKELCMNCCYGKTVENKQAYDDGNGISVHFGPPGVVRTCPLMPIRQRFTENVETKCETKQFSEKKLLEVSEVI